MFTVFAVSACNKKVSHYTRPTSLKTRQFSKYYRIQCILEVFSHNALHYSTVYIMLHY